MKKKELKNYYINFDCEMFSLLNDFKDLLSKLESHRELNDYDKQLFDILEEYSHIIYSSRYETSCNYIIKLIERK